MNIKEFSILCMGRWKTLGSLNSLLSYAPQLPGAKLVSLFTQLLAFPQLLHNNEGSAASTGSVLGALIHIWRPEIAKGCDIPCLLIWQEIFSFHRRQSLNHWTTRETLQKDIQLAITLEKCLFLIVDGENIMAQFPIKFTQLINLLLIKSWLKTRIFSFMHRILKNHVPRCTRSF